MQIMQAISICVHLLLGLYFKCMGDLLFEGARSKLELQLRLSKLNSGLLVMQLKKLHGFGVFWRRSM
jgi:hypothetical protein